MPLVHGRQIPKKLTALALILALFASETTQAQAKALKTSFMPEMANPLMQMQTDFDLPANYTETAFTTLKKSGDIHILHAAFYTSRYDWTRYYNPLTDKTISWHYRIRYKITPQQEQSAEKVIKRLAAKAKKIKSKRKRAEYIYSSVIRNVKYKTGTPYNYTSYGALIKKKACCQGIADAFVMTCDKAGIPAKFVIGKTGKNEKIGAHIWARIKIGGKWYECDPTWDVGWAKHMYFMRSKKDFRKLSHYYK